MNSNYLILLALKLIAFILQWNLAFIYNHKQDFDSWILMHYIIIFLIKNNAILVLNLRI